MKQGMIKAYEPIDDEILSEINQFTKKPLAAAEVYAFSMILCDNEIDRDIERFTFESLLALSEMYKGKPGVFDHNHKSESQTARIFRTGVFFEENRFTSIGEPYCYLLASAYIPRIPKTADTIANIDAGIVKEVSVGVSMRKTLCSTCGREAGTCTHIKGTVYDGEICHILLSEPADAYEFSFVAVPAQLNAGIVKNYDPYSPARINLKREILKIYMEVLTNGNHERF